MKKLRTFTKYLKKRSNINGLRPLKIMVLLRTSVVVVGGPCELFGNVMRLWYVMSPAPPCGDVDGDVEIST